MSFTKIRRKNDRCPSLSSATEKKYCQKRRKKIKEEKFLK